jgi:predicted O-linked N-acetylglucosamine transferase (SPINDLY family)
LGLEELVASSPGEYERIARALALDPGRLRDVRHRLAQARTTSSLFDAQHFARGIEAAFLEMHRRTSRGMQPECFHVGDVSQGTLNG